MSKIKTFTFALLLFSAASIAVFYIVSILTTPNVNSSQTSIKKRILLSSPTIETEFKDLPAFYNESSSKLLMDALVEEYKGMGKGSLKNKEIVNHHLQNQILMRNRSPQQLKVSDNRNDENNITGYEACHYKKNSFYILGAYPQITGKFVKAFYQQLDHGLYNDDDYCQKVDSYNLAHPENMFERMNFFTDYAIDGEEIVRREFVTKFANDTMKEISMTMPRPLFTSRTYHLDQTINSFFTKKASFHILHKLGQNFACATQMYNHIPGHESICRKDTLIESIEFYEKKYNDRPHCFNKNLIFPFNYRLNNKEECTQFFNELNSQEYKASLAREPTQYLIKIGQGYHKSKGVFLLDDYETNYLNRKYNNGLACGTISNSLLAQRYITNPLLLDLNNKFDFRIYMLVASTNPLIAYYHDGFLRVSLTPYNKYSTDRDVHLTNTFVHKDKFEEVTKQNTTINGMDEASLRDYHIWDYEKLQSYLLETGKISDPDWINNYLKPSFKKIMIHLARIGYNDFLKQSNVYEVLGLDFMLDEDFNLWFIECNVSPQFIETNQRSLNFLVKMLKDLFEVQYSYYRSRMKRALSIVKSLEEDIEVNGANADYEKWKMQYKEAISNRLETEYKISEDNSFSLIIDENLPGAQGYFGFLSDECVV